MPDDAFPENSRADGPGDEWMDARVEAYAEGALPPAERAAFEERLHEAPRWRDEVRRARRLTQSLRTLPQPDCPPAVTQAVLDQTVRQATRRPDRPATPRPTRRATRATRPAAWQPALALAALLAMAAAAALLGRPEAPADAGNAPYTHAEVERAEAQAEWALALVAQVTRETGQTVREDVLGERVAPRLAAPVREALATPALSGALPRAARPPSRR